MPAARLQLISRSWTAGSLELAGLLIDVKDGKAAISFGDFVKGKHEKAIWLYRKGMLPIPGALTFA